jgi:sialidase-1
LVLRVSEDEGDTWPAEILVHDKAAAYSDVAVLPDGTVLVLFENGSDVGRPYQRISLARIATNVEAVGSEPQATGR